MRQGKAGQSVLACKNHACKNHADCQQSTIYMKAQGFLQLSAPG
jgi:hypothetical protein